jgi:septal ring factor EnvC (AmiA/AmiB activator)
MKCAVCDYEVEADESSCPQGHTHDAGPTVLSVAQGAAAAPRAPRRPRLRLVAVGLGSLVLVGLLTAGVVSDIGTRRSLDASRNDLSTETAKLQAANARLGTQSKQLSAQASELATLHDNATHDEATISTLQQRLYDTSQREEQLRACAGSFATFFQDVLSRQAQAADRDYRMTFKTCSDAGVDMPLP